MLCHVEQCFYFEMEFSVLVIGVSQHHIYSAVILTTFFFSFLFLFFFQTNQWPINCRFAAAKDTQTFVGSVQSEFLLMISQSSQEFTASPQREEEEEGEAREGVGGWILGVFVGHFPWRVVNC